MPLGLYGCCCDLCLTAATVCCPLPAARCPLGCPPPFLLFKFILPIQ